MPLSKYFNRLPGQNYHELCTDLKPPPNSGELLGLGLKFCLQSRRPYSKPLTSTFERLERDTRLKYFFGTDGDAVDSETDTSSKHRRKLYIKSTWPPPLASPTVEDRLANWERSIVDHRSFLAKVSRPATNLSKIQLNLLEKLRNDKNFIVLQTDKNLGPAIMERKNYINLVLEQHLLDQDTYEELQEKDGTHLLATFKSDLMDILDTYDSSLSDYEKKYFNHALAFRDRVPLFYGTPKVHKLKALHREYIKKSHCDL